MITQNPRRAKVVSICPDHIIELFRQPRVVLDADESALAISSLYFPDLPAGCQVDWVDWNYSERTMDCVVSHPSFPEIPQGERLPEIAGLTRVEVLRMNYVAYDPDHWRKDPLL